MNASTSCAERSEVESTRADPRTAGERPTDADLAAARARITAALAPTPVVAARSRDAWLKLENLQITGIVQGARRPQRDRARRGKWRQARDRRRLGGESRAGRGLGRAPLRLERMRGRAARCAAREGGGLSRARRRDCRRRRRLRVVLGPGPPTGRQARRAARARVRRSGRDRGASDGRVRARRPGAGRGPGPGGRGRAGGGRRARAARAAT